MAKYLQNSADIEINEVGDNLQFEVVKEYFESGSNANGSWIKYNDGTMIQYGKSITGTTAYTTAYGNGYYDNAEHTVTFPIEFYNDNVYVSSIAFVGFGLGGCSMTALTKTSFNYYIFSIRSYTFSSSPYITWIAIGRWKE